METFVFFWIALGFLLLIVGAELLVRGASRLAAAVGLSPLVIGLTVVAYGTSAPELAVSIQGTFAGEADIALGNVVGSNIFNVLFILGISGIVAPLFVDVQLIQRDIWVMIVVSLTVAIFGFNEVISKIEGAVLLASGAGYSAWLVMAARRSSPRLEHGKQPARPGNFGIRSGILNSASILIGLAMLVLGAHWLVESVTVVSLRLGVSELVLGLTVVAAGTSLPEVATSVVASFRGERDIAVGNVVGSNIFNLLAVLGAAAVFSPDGVAVSRSALAFDIPVMVAAALACLPVFSTGHRIDRWEAALFAAYYGAYVGYLILEATRSTGIGLYRAAMLGFVVPLTTITILVIWHRSFQKERSRQA